MYLYRARNHIPQLDQDPLASRDIKLPTAGKWAGIGHAAGGFIPPCSAVPVIDYYITCIIPVPCHCHRLIKAAYY